ncbi:Uncharacterized protein APZ42_029128 [Daphnia magna]|uniref:Uncharacterized protein n=1 Tax=Daphnia magna TaxID=35525 RepID=A0A164PX19_9CRUS|nr:Uncharacterized protein APZ42_029128 [Daphnia magna]
MNGVEMTLEGKDSWPGVCHFRLAEDGRNEGDESVEQWRCLEKCFHFSNCLSSAFFYQFFENLLFEFEKPPLCYRLEIDISIDRGRRQGIIVCDTTLGFGKTPSF